MSTLDGDDVEYLNGLIGGLRDYVAGEVTKVHKRINKVEDCANCNKREIATLKERSQWLKWGLITVMGGIVGFAFGLAAAVARGLI